jgi:hypothetical protein
MTEPGAVFDGSEMDPLVDRFTGYAEVAAGFILGLAMEHSLFRIGLNMGNLIVGALATYGFVDGVERLRKYN